MRVGENFLLGFLGNLGPGAIKRVDLPDNMISDKCMHNIKTHVIKFRLHAFFLS